MADPYDTEAQRRANTQRFVQMMQQQALSGQPQGRGIGAFLLPVAQAWAANKMEEQGKTEAETYQKERTAGLGGELANFLKMYNGQEEKYPGPTESGGLPEGAPGPLAPSEPAVKADPRTALVNAMASRYPEMQEIGKAQMPGLLKPMKPATPKFAYHGDGIFREDPGADAPVRVGATKEPEKWSAPYMLQLPGLAKPVAVKRNEITGEVKAIASEGTTVNVGTETVDTAAAKAAGAATPEVLKGARDKIMTVQKTMDQSDRILTALEDPAVITGFGANLETGAKSLAKRFGWDDKDAVPKTQLLATDLASKTLDASIVMKGALSDNDVKFLTQVAAGSITLDAKTLERVALITKKQAHYEAMQSLEQYQSVANGPGGQYATNLHPMPKFDWKMPPKYFKRRSEGNDSIFDIVEPGNLTPGPGRAAPAPAGAASAAKPMTEVVMPDGRRIPIRKVN